VTLESIYAVVLETRDGIREVKGQTEDLSIVTGDHEKRIRKLEAKVYYTAGAAAALGGGLGVTVAKGLGIA